MYNFLTAMPASARRSNSSYNGSALVYGEAPGAQHNPAGLAPHHARALYKTTTKPARAVWLPPAARQDAKDVPPTQPSTTRTATLGDPHCTRCCLYCSRPLPKHFRIIGKAATEGAGAVRWLSNGSNSSGSLINMDTAYLSNSCSRRPIVYLPF